MAERANILTAMEAWWGRSDSITVLITGKTGTGKSSLVNAILGKEVAKVGLSLDPETSEVTAFENIIEGIKVCVYDSPGLQDGQGLEKEAMYLEDIKTRCKDKIDLFIYCVSMTTKRFTDGSRDISAMVKLTDTLGKEIWNNAIFVLTCANKLITTIKSTIPKCDADITEQVKDEYQKKLDGWKLQIKHVLNEVVKLPTDTIEELPIVPAGRRGLPLLFKDPICLPWLSSLWMDSLLAMKTNAQPALIKMNQQRLKKRSDIRSQREFEELLSKEAIIIMAKGGSIGRQMRAEREGMFVGLYSGITTGLAHLLERLFLRNYPIISDIRITCDEEETKQAIYQFVQDLNNN